MYSSQFTQYILGLVFLVTSSFALSNTEFTYNLSYRGDTGEAVLFLNGCQGACPSELVIPDEIDGYPVNNIEMYAFSSMGLESVILPQSLTYIGDGAFSYNSLTDISFPDNITYINNHAFENNELTNLTIPESVISIGGGAFANNNLTNITMAGVKNIGYESFLGNQISTINLPINLESIHHRAFKGNLISNIVFPESINFLGKNSFSDNPITGVKFLGERPSLYLGYEMIHEASFYETQLEIVTYCQVEGWETVSIEGVTPQLDASCSNTNEENEPITYSVFDIDQNGSFDALTDGLILLRYAFGLTGDNLINGVISPDANRTSAADIEAYIESHMP